MEKNYIIYKIVSKDLNIKDTYIGSTTNFKARKNCHKSRCTSESDKYYNTKVYKFIRENGGWEDWEMVMIEETNCTKRQAELKEREYYEQLNADLNGKKPFIDTEEKKDIKKEKDKEYRINNEEKVKAQKKEHYENNKEIILEKQKIYREKNKEEIKERKKEYYQRNKEEIAEKNKEYREANRDKKREMDKKYYNDNKEKISEKSKEIFACECGDFITIGAKSNHLKSKKHLDYINNLEKN